MNRWYVIPAETKANAYTQIADKTGMAPYAVEKDWWVVQTLAIIFEMEIGAHLVFKGGTSLSKAWRLIDRFSEDIDLAVNRNFLGFDGDLSRGQIKNLRKAANAYISGVFYPALMAKFQEKGLVAVRFKITEAETADQDPRIIEVYYPNVIATPGYIQPRVQIEIGCRSLREPFTDKSFSSLVDEHYPAAAFTQALINIPVVNPERTLLEKIFLLHEEFQRPDDIYQLSKTEFADKAFENPALYETIVNHRYKFTPVGGVDYNLHQPKHINPIPGAALLEAWKKDYATMKEQMIYGDAPSFNQMLASIKEFVSKINALDWVIQGEYNNRK
jgi:hypothetical protein